MTQVETPDTIAVYKYDGLGKRIEKEVDGTITHYIYDNEDILCEYDGVSSLTARYTHGPGIDEPIQVTSHTSQVTSYYYHTDGLGSVTQLTDSIGGIVQSYLYDSFGRIIDRTGTIPNPYTYTGREYDSESGLYYYRARYYDSTIGRFLQEDPFPGNTFFPLSLNLYPYVSNNPINYTDPAGEIAPFVIGAMIGGGISLVDITSYYIAEKYYNWRYGIDVTAHEVYARKAIWGVIISLVPTPGARAISRIFYTAPAIAIQSWMSYGTGKFIMNVWERLFKREKPGRKK